ncbi:hypothetical protein ABTW24_13555 [Sphingobacterium thalpophilum]|uniref:Uncharacterized protein n=1 Tax=Sphingobacterium thalpophilum TaxID=259 RepID=A0A4U9V174_9SPHI|nr:MULTISPECIES: hypothetical protein [Sphingobacterium]MCW8312102.1 hypothetical protein [Sphingobacterium sp. InxBP1]VTR40166.1 Uncharacterised protein [Sphingobacterium thalpophilum]
MKYIFGILFTLVILFVATYFLLGLWGIRLLDAENFSKILWTTGILTLTSIILVCFVVIPFFGSGKNGRYEDKGKVAQRKTD